MNAYEKLYTNMKNRFTVVNNNVEYTLGDYMLMKAGSKKENTSNLPAMRTSKEQKPIAAFFNYVNDKLTLKVPPVKDKTMRAFPFRTSAAALLSAVVACTLLISYGSAAVKNSGSAVPMTADSSVTEQNEKDDAKQDNFTFEQ